MPGHYRGSILKQVVVVVVVVAVVVPVVVSSVAVVAVAATQMGNPSQNAKAGGTLKPIIQVWHAVYLYCKDNAVTIFFLQIRINFITPEFSLK